MSLLKQQNYNNLREKKEEETSRYHSIRCVCVWKLHIISTYSHSIRAPSIFHKSRRPYYAHIWNNITSSSREPIVRQTEFTQVIRYVLDAVSCACKMLRARATAAGKCRMQYNFPHRTSLAVFSFCFTTENLICWSVTQICSGENRKDEGKKKKNK